MAKNIVITGSTRGIGQGLARAFLGRGHNVVISGRTDASVAAGLQALAGDTGESSLSGCACDVADLAQVKALWDHATTRLGSIDIWINNAGVDGASLPFTETPESEIETIVGANILGVLYGTKVALKGMQAAGGGTIYNFEGFGSNDMMRTGMTTYGTTKRGVTYFTDSIAREIKGGPVNVCHISPGMVVTDLLMSGLDDMSAAEQVRVRKFYNILADKVETVTPWLADEALKGCKNGGRIAWLTRGKAMRRFLTASFSKRDLFAD